MGRARLALSLLLARATAQTAEQLVDTWGVAGLLEFVPTTGPDRCDYIPYSPAINYSQPGAPAAYPGTWTWDAAQPNSLTDTSTGVTFPNSTYPTVAVAAVGPFGDDTTLMCAFRAALGPFARRMPRRAARVFALWRAFVRSRTRRAPRPTAAGAPDSACRVQQRRMTAPLTEFACPPPTDRAW